MFDQTFRSSHIDELWHRSCLYRHDADSHPNFIRNDPVGICLMKRKSRKKAPKASQVGSPGPRPDGPRSMPDIHSAGPEIGSVAATGFGQEYHVIASRLADWPTSLSAPNPPLGSELSDIFDCEGFNSTLATRPNPNESASPHSFPTAHEFSEMTAIAEFTREFEIAHDRTTDETH